jgi:hypothetical protein
LAVSVPNILFAKDVLSSGEKLQPKEGLFHRYPSIDDEIVSEIVGKSHFNLDRVRELVDPRPELARATWDWGFGDWETAVGAASHVGRRDIVNYLLSKGARPDIFTYAALGQLDAVKSMIAATPAIQSIDGPHGISLLRHAKNGIRSEELTEAEILNGKQLIAYLEELGNADPKVMDIEIEEGDKQKYLGDYMYGDGPKDGFSIKLNMRDMLALGKLGSFGGGLFQIAPNSFMYNGAPSVEISFKIEDGKVRSLTVSEPELSLTAVKV